MQDWETKEAIAEVEDRGEQTNSLGQRVGVIEGIASTEHVDRVNDIVDRSAMMGHKPQDVRMLWQHDAKQPIGRWTDFEMRKEGLWVRGEILLETRAGREAYELLRAGALNGLSIGYKVLPGGSEMVRKMVNGASRRIRHIKKLFLGEISIVTVQCNPYATVSSVKSIDDLAPDDRETIEAGVRAAHSYVQRHVNEIDREISKLRGRDDW